MTEPNENATGGDGKRDRPEEDMSGEQCFNDAFLFI
jgi:hypothetical protein